MRIEAAWLASGGSATGCQTCEISASDRLTGVTAGRATRLQIAVFSPSRADTCSLGHAQPSPGLALPG